MTFKTQEELDIFLLNGGRVQFLNWKKSSSTFMYRDLDGRLYYGDDLDPDHKFGKPVALDYRQVRRFVPVPIVAAPKKVTNLPMGHHVVFGTGLLVGWFITTVICTGIFK
jgi:hypothetical protein